MPASSTTPRDPEEVLRPNYTKGGVCKTGRAASPMLEHLKKIHLKYYTAARCYPRRY